MAVKDPAVKKNGRCHVCNKERPEAAVLANDPFCSSGCCRDHHGHPLPPSEYERKQQKKKEGS